MGSFFGLVSGCRRSLLPFDSFSWKKIPHTHQRLTFSSCCSLSDVPRQSRWMCWGRHPSCKHVWEISIETSQLSWLLILRSQLKFKYFHLKKTNFRYENEIQSIIVVVQKVLSRPGPAQGTIHNPSISMRMTGIQFCLCLDLSATWYFFPQQAL